MSIAENILNSAAQNSNLSSKKDLEEYFSVAVFDDKLWPFDFKKDEVKTEYLCAHILPDQFGISEELNLDIKFSFPDCNYLLSEKIFADDGLEIELKSIIRQNGTKKDSDKFVYNLLDKHQKFIKEFALKNDIDSSEAKIKIHAHSGNIDGVKTVGGYIWATYGFDFANEAELNAARKAFQRYVQEHNVSISDKDLKYFKYPCHFAAFDTGQNIGEHTLGKAFLLQFEWYGVRKADLSEKSELFRYQKAYHEKSKEAAQAELSKSFLAVMNKYKHKNEHKENTLAEFSLIKDRIFQDLFHRT